MAEQPPAKRPLWITVALLPLAACALWGSSALAWGGREKARPGTDVPIAVDVPGSEVAPALVPVALLALAAVAGVLAVSGTPRRALGVVLAAAAVYPVWAGVGADALTWGSATAVAGGALLALAGVVVALTGHRMPRMGSRYSAPANSRTAGESGKPGKARPDLWQSLSDGDDPTDARS
ncbi:Trp biosynthesis-associated membrane protein [Actinokineospora guangxiensis]|uniref:Trp biosynthesis-associated membrane protein n=1 Tax=Actinokineospora guangxiensis TaxID=1490288 RepID=A0ABW0ETC5_9PSEU